MAVRSGQLCKESLANMKFLELAVIYAAVAGALPTGSSSYGGGPMVTVKNGTVEGLHSSTYNQDCECHGMWIISTTQQYTVRRGLI